MQTIQSFVITRPQAEALIGNSNRFAFLLRKTLQNNPAGGIISILDGGAELHVYPRNAARRYTISGSGADVIHAKLQSGHS